MKTKTLVMAVGLAVAALGSIGAANAIPMLQIIGGTSAEAIGDPGGTAYPSAPSAVPVPVAGAGIPTALGGWPTPSPDTFGADSSFGGGKGYFRLPWRLP